MKPEDLTDKQYEALAVIKRYMDEHRYPPSTREIMRACGLKSTAPVTNRLRILRDKGYLTWNPQGYRTFIILKEIECEQENAI